MASSEKNLSSFSGKGTTDISQKRFAVIVSEWNEEITDSLYNGVVETLMEYGAQKENVIKKDVPGSFELTLAAQWMAQLDDIDAVICLGCVIKGETKHDEYISNAVAQGLTDVGLKYNKPVIFGVLTPNTKQQALDRAGGKHGNKGDEAAITAIKMLGFSSQ
ncbi:MAG: 6,7-dimethyl-8-ribityllumazine synthase [Bacteroidota bacterium]